MSVALHSLLALSLLRGCREPPERAAERVEVSVVLAAPRQETQTIGSTEPIARASPRERQGSRGSGRARPQPRKAAVAPRTTTTSEEHAKATPAHAPGPVEPDDTLPTTSPAPDAPPAVQPTSTPETGRGGHGPSRDSRGESQTLNQAGEDWQRIRDATYQNLRYPLVARRMGWKGQVVLRFRIQSSGRVSQESVLTSSGFALLDESAMAALRRASPFPPRAHDVDVVLPITFDLH